MTNMTESTIGSKMIGRNSLTKTPVWLWLTPFAALLLVYQPALFDLVRDWYYDSNNTHGFLIPPVVGFFLFRKRAELASAPRQRDWAGLVVVVIGMVLFVVANAAAEYFTLRFSFVLTIFGLVYFLFGREIVRLTAFEIGLLLFMIPIPYVIYYAVTFPMQLLSSKITVAALNLLGAAAVRQGNIIHLADTSLEVAEACSGIRSLMSLLTLGAIYAYLSQKRMWARGVLFLSTIPIAIIGNVGRVFVLSLLVYLLGIDATAEPWHSGLGLLVFVVALVMLFLEAALLRRLTR
jgi:exosortase